MKCIQEAIRTEEGKKGILSTIEVGGGFGYLEKELISGMEEQMIRKKIGMVKVMVELVKGGVWRREWGRVCVKVEKEVECAMEEDGSRLFDLYAELDGEVNKLGKYRRRMGVGGGEEEGLLVAGKSGGG